MRFNINDHVAVRLTERGRAIATAHYETQAATYGSTPIIVEEIDGWSRWQLWHLMEVFGHVMGMTQSLVFETEIVIP